MKNKIFHSIMWVLIKLKLCIKMDVKINGRDEIIYGTHWIL